MRTTSLITTEGVPYKTASTARFTPRLQSSFRKQYGSCPSAHSRVTPCIAVDVHISPPPFVISEEAREAVALQLDAATPPPQRISWDAAIRHPEGDYESLEDYLAAIQKGFVQHRLQRVQNEPAWQVSLWVEVVPSSLPLVSYQITREEQLGFLYAERTTSFRHFDLETGQELLLEDVLGAQKYIRLSRIAKPYFENSRAAFAEALDEATREEVLAEGFFLPEDFALHKDALELHYAAGSIAPEEAGSFPVFIPREKVEGLFLEEPKELPRE